MSRRWLSGWLLIFSMHAQGGELLPFMPSASEMALLPEYCKARFTDQHSPQYQAWTQRVGPKFLSIHHYCAGLNYINRYQRLVNDEKRGYYLSRAVPEIDYVAKNMPADFVLAGEIYLNRGIAYKLMGNNAAAARDFMKALERDPKQARAYLYLSEIQMKSGSKDKALELVSIGLKRAPGSKALQRKYLQLGGKEPFPVAETTPTAPVTAEQGEAPPALVETPEVSAPAAEVTPTPEPSAPAKAANEAENPSTDGEVRRPAIGAPGNPYCRFCP